MSKALPILERAVAAHQAGRLGQARTLYQQALKLDPRHYDGRYLLAMLECQDGRAAAVLSTLRRLAAEQPGRMDVLYTYGRALHEAGDHGAALGAYGAVMARYPSNADAFLEAARSCMALRDWGRAAAVCDWGVAVHPAHPLLWAASAAAAGAAKRDADAVAAMERADRLQPGDADILYGLGRALRLVNRTGDAAGALGRALALRPGMEKARMLLARLLPVIYDSAGEVALWRGRIEEALRALPAGPPPEPAAAFDAVADTANFYLAYQGLDDREPACLWGAFVQRVVAARFPDLVQPPRRGGRKGVPPGRRIRVGFRSAFLRDHTVLHLFRGWMTGLDRARFEVFAYGEGEGDAETGRLAAAVEHFRSLPPDIEKAARRIRADGLDVLVHLDVGMEPLGQIYGSMRLAPVQAAAWGHPVTTGLGQIDWFLSADSMEPAGADAHYGERLLRLPGLSVSFDPPELPARPADRSTLGGGSGLSPEHVLFFCGQSLFKLLPQHDHVWAEIAARAPAARFLFLETSAPEVVAVLRRRFDRAFAAYGLTAADHVVWVPPVDRSGYLALNMASDLFLDSLDWSGGRTALEAVACGLLPLTCPGPFMRARHTAGILAELGLPELVAADKPALVELAVSLAGDRARREALRQRMIANRAALFADRRWQAALEAWITAEAARAA
ncbi:O-linked N-acetylglucosamine transferase, SPINDLY family protein [Azospirillum picis]|uniref:protein O-GlcNAc transferase n=1 Tax=Azospirillum picis TaxID=488438 RepID=A0ABU0MQX6_9PROT|nr:tetratricopeptide repeat protein [Azospirillum picis]MBP2302150.1 putative O-linked N-acetylglucosamine transferase (SPINDLY family) [Azospirillum picis]MDQ0535729.1 putative O-linked N-acetylglucosamine transferase (SPINDLY family) [Azospirillum picis]